MPRNVRLSLFLSTSLLIYAYLPLHAQTTEQREAELSKSFRCPEEFSNNAARADAVGAFIKAYTIAFPANNTRDLVLFRYRLLVDHSCTQTLNALLLNVSPVTEMLRFQAHGFGPRTDEFDAKTGGWTSWFRLDGQTPQMSSTNLIFNFYASPGPSPAAIVQAFLSPRPQIHILGKFEAPDDVTHAPAFMVVSTTANEDGLSCFVNVTKITNPGSGTYAVTFTKNFEAASSGEAQQAAIKWLLTDEGKAVEKGVGGMSVSNNWNQYFQSKK